MYNIFLRRYTYDMSFLQQTTNNVFTARIYSSGATFMQSFKGQFTCQHCGVLLRIKSYGKHFWSFYILTIISLVLLFLVFKYFSAISGIIWTGLLLVMIVAFIFSVWSYFNSWKRAIIEQVSTNKSSVAG